MTSPRDPAGISYRPTTEADIPALYDVFVAAEGELLERHGFAWPAPPPPDRLASSHRHLLAHDGEHCFVAGADGRVVGYSACLVRGETTFLAALFIHPQFQGRGVGHRLLDLALDGTPPRRITISDAIQPVSNALYAKRGMFPVTPVLAFGGSARFAPQPDLQASGPDTDALARLDLAAYGFDRLVDHGYWDRNASGTLWLRDGVAVAYSYRWPTGRIGPIAGVDAEAAGSALAAELARRPDAYVEITGTSRGLARVAFEAGLRLFAPPGLLLLSREVRPPDAIAISSYGLM